MEPKSIIKKIAAIHPIIQIGSTRRCFFCQTEWKRGDYDTLHSMDCPWSAAAETVSLAARNAMENDYELQGPDGRPHQPGEENLPDPF